MDVELRVNALGVPVATYELGTAGARIVVEGYEDETIEDVVEGMCCALAVLNFRGEVRLFNAGVASEEAEREMRATIERFNGKLWITDEDGALIAAEEERLAEKAQAEIKKVRSFMQQEGLRRGLNKEERESMTFGEAISEPYKED
jgi:hypothetical protein